MSFDKIAQLLEKMGGGIVAIFAALLVAVVVVAVIRIRRGEEKGGQKAERAEAENPAGEFSGEGGSQEGHN